MNIIAKLIAVKYPRGVNAGKKSDVATIYYLDNIKSTIGEYLFIDNYDYVVLTYDGKLFVCEKNSDDSYSRRSILYHPLMNELSFT
jgi:hypothetical protein